MKKKFKLIELDCANCAAKIEDSINKLPDVKSASVNFMLQRLTVEADDSVFDSVMNDIAAVIKKIEPECEIVR